MKTYWLGLALALAACGGDDTSSGARGQCAEGGELNACPPPDPTPEGACTYLVECGVIPIESGTMNHQFDWGDCVNNIEGDLDTGEQLVIDCITHSSCDSLKVDGSPDKPNAGQIACFHLGGN